MAVATFSPADSVYLIARTYYTFTPQYVDVMTPSPYITTYA